MSIREAFSKESLRTFGLIPHSQPPETIKPLNPADSQKLDENKKKSVAIIGAGFAGLSAALELAERGFSITIYEIKSVIGGKLATPQLQTSQGLFHVEHGLHMWFYNYYTCHDIIRRLSCSTHFRPYRKVSVAFRKYKQEVIRSEPPIYPFNLIGIILRSPNLHITDMKYLLDIIPDLMYFRYDSIYARLDNISYKNWAYKKGVSKKIFDILFEPASSITINDPETISAAELVTWMHYFFIGHPKAMWRQIAKDHHAKALLDPWYNYLKKLGVEFRLDYEVLGLKFSKNKVVGILNDDKHFDWIILASDIGATKKIIHNSDTSDENSEKIKTKLNKKIHQLKIAPSYRIIRAWFDSQLENHRPDILETPQYRPLHLIAQFHLLEEESRLWAQKTGGSVVEFHFYADDTIAKIPHKEVWAYVKPLVLDVIPELASSKLLDYKVGTYSNFTSFDVGQGSIRPTTDFPIDYGCKNLLYAGDWVHTQFPSALMERAAVTGRLAANQILKSEGVRQATVVKCSNRGPGLF